MCVECGTALNVSTSTVADQERAFIRRQIAHGQGQAGGQGRAGRGVRPRRARRPAVERLRPRRLPRARCCWRCSASPGWRSPRGAGAAAPAPRRAGPGEPLGAEDARRLDAELAALRPAMTRRRRHDGARRLRGRLRVVHLALRAAARPRLPVGGLRRHAGRAPARRARQRAAPRARLLPLLHGRLRRARHDRHRPRLDAAGLARHARRDRRARSSSRSACCSCSRRSCRA